MGETCIYDDQDVISEKEQGGRCNELVRKNQTSMLYVPDAKSSVEPFVLRQDVSTTGFEDESILSGGDLSCPQSWIGSSRHTLVRGDEPVRSHDLKTSVSWSISMVKGNI